MTRAKRRITDSIKAELKRLADTSRTGRLHWEDVVRAARNKSNPLHSYFDWDKNRAMEAYLKQQAEALITGYYVVITNPHNGDKARTRAFVSLSSDRRDGGGYHSILQILSDDEMRAQLLKDALAELATFRLRYTNLLELGKLFDEIERLEQRVQRNRSRAQAARLQA